jgi:ADP-heptose:LPS heptosyltransferase
VLSLPPKPKILIIKLRSIGDVIYNTAIYAPIKKTWPDARLTVVVEPPSYEIVRYHPDIDKVLIFDKSTLANQVNFYWNLYKENYDIAIDMHEGPRGAGMCFLSSAYHKVGNKFAPRSFVYNTKIDFSDLKPKHPMDYQVALIKKLGVQFDQPKPNIFIPEYIHERVDRLLIEKGIPDSFYVMHSGARPYDQWQLQKFADLAKIINQQYGFKVVLTCGPGQENTVEKIIRKIENIPYVFLQAGLNELAAITKRSKFVVCHNGGYMHLSAAVGTPTIALFGTSSPHIWSPLSTNHIILRYKPDQSFFSPKNMHKLGIQKDFSGKEFITVEEALSAVNKILINTK